MQTDLASLLAPQMRTAAQLEQSGQLAQAEAIYRQIVQAYSSFDPAWHALGLQAYHAGNFPLAVQYIEAAIAGNDRVALYHRNIGEMYRRLGSPERAILAGRRACKLAPKDIDAHYNLGLAHTDAGHYKKAVAAYRLALKLNDTHGLSWNNLGSALEQLGDKNGAQSAYQRAVDIDPRHAEAQNNLGAIFTERGKLDDARSCFAAAIAVMPEFVEAHYNLSSLKNYKQDDPHLATLERLHGARERLSDHARIRYCFALGKALDDTGDHDRAFAAYDEGNRLQHQLMPMDEVRAEQEMQRVLDVFTDDFFQARRTWKGASARPGTPIFIVGMPRSGTSLLEQILSSHPSVFGAGELSDLHDIAQAAISDQPDQPRLFADGINLLDDKAVRRIGDDYLKRVWKLSPHSGFITDKMPANFFYLGLLHLALPDARIIHAMRDPMDSCFSCYARLFNSTMEFAYDQGTLGRYYRRYMTLMRHWHRVLPPGTILDLPYENMVSDTEQQARRVLDFVGLPWDPACLDFHKNDRVVRTASMAQVRRPIYKTSVARWKHFARHLRPLYELVKDWRASNDDLPVELLNPPAPADFVLPAAAAQSAEAFHIEGIALYTQTRLQEALALYDRALAVRADFPQALNSRGFVLQDLGRLPEALTCFQRAIELAPQMAMARLNLGMLQLKLGHWEAGWENYESRWTGSAEAGSGSHARPRIPLPQWDGQQDTQHQRLLVVTEQGFGDTLQFLRYLPLAARRFAKVGFICSQSTQRLIEWSSGDCIVTSTRLPADYAAWDLHCPLMSLPRAFGTRPDAIPADLPYLNIPGPAAQHWRDRLDIAAPNRLRVGIAWAGRKAHRMDARRSLRVGQLQSLFADTRVSWVSLQKWAPEDARPTSPAGTDWIDWTDECMDFADTAALVENLDLVISIDSAMVHLAGGLGKPVWMMNRFDTEWRWFDKRDDSPWYPSLRIFNQPTFGDWDSVLRDVAQALHQLPAPRAIAAPRPRATPALPARAATSPALQADALPGAVLTAGQGLQQASQLQGAGRMQEAEQWVRKVLQVEPGNAQAIHLLGVIAWSANQHAEALELLGQAVALDGNIALFHSNLAEMQRQSGNLQAAIAYGTRALAIDPSLASAWTNLGIAHYDASDYDRAQACHDKALSLVPNMPASLNNLGSIARGRRDLDQAAQWYQRVLQADPNHLEALSNIAAVLLEDGKPDLAEPHVLRALALQPHYPEALCNLGLVRVRQERFEEAEGLLRRSLALRPGYAEAMVGLAGVLRAKAAPDAALDLTR